MGFSRCGDLPSQRERTSGDFPQSEGDSLAGIEITVLLSGKGESNFIRIGRKRQNSVCRIIVVAYEVKILEYPSPSAKIEINHVFSIQSLVDGNSERCRRFFVLSDGGLGLGEFDFASDILVEDGKPHL